MNCHFIKQEKDKKKKKISTLYDTHFLPPEAFPLYPIGQELRQQLYTSPGKAEHVNFQKREVGFTVVGFEQLCFIPQG